ncbi:Myb-like domain-containing protein [Entamoeba marina]
MSFYDLPPINDPTYTYCVYSIYVNQSRNFESLMAKLSKNNERVTSSPVDFDRNTFFPQTFHTQLPIETIESSLLLNDFVVEQSESPFHSEDNDKGRYWSNEENNLFIKAVTHLNATTCKGLNCLLISRFIGTRTPVQVRTHAQKYFMKQNLTTLSMTHEESKLFQELKQSLKFKSKKKQIN